ncbi:hypothetical protein GGR55DRAFT_619301 [Xylaria sp. FL0064]|nr:hypothetical protein GGR55DRAFT_619301 [Xylaria sp. FL0064]
MSGFAPAIMDFKSHTNHFLTIVNAISTILGLEFHEIINAQEDNTFVKLGGDSLAAILIAAECQKKGISIPASIFLRASNLKEAIAKAESSARTFDLLPGALPTLTSASLSLSAARSPEAPVSSTSPLSLRKKSIDKTPSLLSSYLPTPIPHNIEAATTPVRYNGQRGISATDLLDRIIATDWTELQLLLLRETSNNQRLNILTIHKTYMSSEWDAQFVCDAWIETIIAEPIFRDLVVDLDIPPHKLLSREIVHVQTEDEFQKSIRNAALASGPLSALTVIQMPSSSVAVVWRVHHSFIDGFSARIIHDKINRSLHRLSLTPHPGPSFKETVCAMRKLREARRDTTRRFWDSKRARFPFAVGELTLRPRGDYGIGISSQKSITIKFPEAELAAARARMGYTTTVYLAAAWALTISQFMDTDQVYFGMVLSGRDLPIPGAFDVVGPLMNIIPLFIELPLENDEEISVRAFLRSIQDSIFEINDLQYSDTTEGLTRKFNSIMATEFDECEGLEQPHLPAMDNSYACMQSQVPLNLIVQGQHHLRLVYSATHFAEDDMDSIVSVFQNGMKGLLRDNDEKLLLSAVRRKLIPHKMEQALRRLSNCGSFETLDESKGDDLVTLFENVVVRQPTAVAISCGHGQDFSYDDLDQAAGAIARELSWIKPNEPVCVYADRSVNWLVAIFGVLKAGGAYAPLDPSTLISVRQANFVRSGARAILFPSGASISAETTPAGCMALSVDELVRTNMLNPRHLQASYPRRRIAHPDDVAYICFTSGSTGQPKGVRCTHKGVVAFQKDWTIRLSAKKGTVIAQVMSPVFDGSIHEIFSTLTYGATLRLRSTDSQDDPFAHLQDCDSAILTPSIANTLNPEEYPRLRNVYFVGEVVPQAVCDAWAKNHTVYNMYGPTEATCGVTIKQLAQGKAVTLGHPAPSSRVYILDRNKNLVPLGSVGELYLAGIQVSDGYIDLLTENASHFLFDSILPEAHQKMYRTGDYAYRDSATGEIHIVGRKDRQIKLQGFRLDLNDLEARITKAIPDCRSVAVFRRDDYLVAAYQIPSTWMRVFSEMEIRALISQCLPSYSMPRKILALFELPLTAVGKLDYEKLQKIMQTQVQQQQNKQTSMTATEIMIVRTVRDLMKLDASISIDRNSSLTALGGHSIVQLQLASRITSMIRMKVSVKQVIDNPIIAQLASSVDEILTKGEMAVDSDEWPSAQSACLNPRSRIRTEMSAVEVGSASSIERLWFERYQKKLGTSSFNVSHVSELGDSLNQHSALVTAWTTVLERHAILRCRFRPSTTVEGSVERFYAAEAPKALYLDSFDLRKVINTEFSLETEHPIRVLVSKKHMLVCVSHIVCDYSTLHTLLEEFTAAYHRDEKVEMSLLASQKRYEDTSWPNHNVDELTSQFWQSYLSGYDFKKLPTYMKKQRTSYAGESRVFRLSGDAVQNLEIISRSLHLTKHQIALGIVSLVLQADNPTKQDLVLGSPFFGRQEEDMSTVGLFVQLLPIRVPRRRSNTADEEDLGDACVADFLLAVQGSQRSALSHGIAWTSLMGLLTRSDDENLRSAAAARGPNHPLFEAMVTFHERDTARKASSIGDQAAKLKGVEPLITWGEGAKFGIMFEFSIVGTSVITLRIEYDTSLFSANEVVTMAGRIDGGLEYLCRHMKSTTKVRDFEEILSNNIWTGNCKRRVESIEFGTRLATLV